MLMGKYRPRFAIRADAFIILPHFSTFVYSKILFFGNRVLLFCNRSRFCAEFYFL